MLYHTQFVEYALDVCCLIENRFIMIVIISISPPRSHVQQQKSNGNAEKATTKLYIITPVALNPRKTEHNIT